MAYIYNLTDSWTAAGTTYSGIKMAVTNTASGASSKLLDLSVSGATTGSFTVDKSGNAAVSGSLTLGSPLAVQYGGTGLATLTTGYIPYGNGTGAFSSSADWVFDGARVGLGTATPSTTLGRNITINGSLGGSNAGFVLQSATVERALMYSNDTVSFFGTSGATPMLIGSNGAERVRIQTTGNLVPSVDNSYTLGADGIRWASVWAVNGTIQTSDLETKTDIAPSPLGLDFVNAIEPVAYRFKIGGNIVTPGENGPTDFTVTPVPGKRQHFGFIAQQIKSVIPPNVDFGGWIKTDPTNPDSEEGLRYIEFLAPMVKAIQELSAKNDVLEARIAALEVKK